MAPRADDWIHFDIKDPGEIVATDNCGPMSFEPFPSHNRKAFNSLCLVIIRGRPGQPRKIKVTATATGLRERAATIKAG